MTYPNRSVPLTGDIRVNQWSSILDTPFGPCIKFIYAGFEISISADADVRVYDCRNLKTTLFEAPYQNNPAADIAECVAWIDANLSSNT